MNMTAPALGGDAKLGAPIKTYLPHGRVPLDKKANLSILRVTFNESKWSKGKIAEVVIAHPSS
jgi:hypothetical protein